MSDNEKLPDDPVEALRVVKEMVSRPITMEPKDMAMTLGVGLGVRDWLAANNMEPGHYIVNVSLRYDGPEKPAYLLYIEIGRPPHA